MMSMRCPDLIITLCAASLLSCGILEAKAQVIVHDTLPAAKKTAEKFHWSYNGLMPIRQSDISAVVSVTGEPDIIRFVQTVPGVATGAEGSSAYYVRGGNMGSNVITLDGVQVFGSSHLLGFSSIYPQAIISSTCFRLGGFTSEEGNLTSSHIGLITADGNLDTLSSSISVSTFNIGASLSAPLVKGRLSFIGSIRVSPINLEYRAFKRPLTRLLDSLNNFNVSMYDLFGKFKYVVNERNSLSLSIFNTLDSYQFDYGSSSHDRMNWGNLIVNFQHDAVAGKSFKLRNNVSFNKFSNHQGEEREMPAGGVGTLEIGGGIYEAAIQSLAWLQVGKYLDIQFGIKSRAAVFNPGSANYYSGTLSSSSNGTQLSNNYSTSLTNTLHGQVEYSNASKFLLRCALRVNANTFFKVRMTPFTSFDPEVSIFVRANINKWLGVEGSFDRLVQYYHTLEGVPLGWSMDMIIPSDSHYSPETALQEYVGAFIDLGNHHFSIGAYLKDMKGLLYYSNASLIFNSSQAGWENDVEIGEGKSRGLEFLYQKQGDVLAWKVAYTLSKTDRTFPGLNDGETFPAKFDRRHILNASSSYKICDNSRFELRVNILYTLQSGHYVTVPLGGYTGILIGGQTVPLYFYSKLNNLRLPDYRRLDAGVSMEFRKPRHKQHLDLGVYNVLNRHNIFAISYNSERKVWQSISLVPIMPNFKWSIDF